MSSTRILISRTDSIGDVILTLPLAGIIKKFIPDSKIYFLGKTYTKDIISLSSHIEGFLNWTNYENISIKEQIEKIKEFQFDAIVHVFPNKEIATVAKKAKIPNRIGTSHRIYNWTRCNKLVNFTRKNSELHEAQLNTQLLTPLGIDSTFSLDELIGYYGFNNVPNLKGEFTSLLDPNRFNIILHTKSKGSAREWGLDNFRGLIDILPEDDYKIFLSGTEEEGLLFRDSLMSGKPNVVDISGTMKLDQFISFIANADGLIAASTGPLHIAASLGKIALGIYPPIKPMHPGRWKPLGIHADYLVKDTSCSDCRNGTSCHCMKEISPVDMFKKLKRMK